MRSEASIPSDSLVLETWAFPNISLVISTSVFVTPAVAVALKKGSDGSIKVLESAAGSAGLTLNKNGCQAYKMQPRYNYSMHDL